MNKTEAESLQAEIKKDFPNVYVSLIPYTQNRYILGVYGKPPHALEVESISIDAPFEWRRIKKALYVFGK